MTRDCRSGAAGRATSRPLATREDEERRWLLGLFARFADEPGDLDALVARRTDREMRRMSGPSRFGERRRAPRGSAGRGLPRPPARRGSEALPGDERG